MGRHPVLIEPLRDAPVRKPATLEGVLGQGGLFRRIDEPRQQARLTQVHPSGTKGFERDRRQGGKRRQTFDVDLGIAEGPRNLSRLQPRRHHPADRGDDVGDMDRRSRIGQNGGRRLTRRIGLDEDLHRMIVRDPPLRRQVAQGEETSAAVQGHGRAFGGPATRPHGQRLQLAGGEQGFRQDWNVVVGGFAVAEVFRRDVEIGERELAPLAGGGDVCRRRGDGAAFEAGTGHGGIPTGGEDHPRPTGAPSRPPFPASRLT